MIKNDNHFALGLGLFVRVQLTPNKFDLLIWHGR